MRTVTDIENEQRSGQHSRSFMKCCHSNHWQCLWMIFAIINSGNMTQLHIHVIIIAILSSLIAMTTASYGRLCHVVIVSVCFSACVIMKTQNLAKISM